MTSGSTPSLCNELARRGGVRLDESQHAKLSRYLDLLLAANAKMNLTRITDRAEAQRLHVADSLTLLPFLPAGEHRLVDVGSGGGVPGIVLAIARPDAKVVLLEATKKKADFLRRAAAELQLVMTGRSFTILLKNVLFSLLMFVTVLMSVKNISKQQLSLKSSGL